MSAANIQRLSYLLTQEQSGDGTIQGYSRLLLNCQSKAEAERLQKLFSDNPYRLECSVLLEKDWKTYGQSGPFVLNILVNVKKAESPHSPGLSLNKAVEAILAQNRVGAIVLVDEHFMTYLNAAFLFKKEKATELFSIFGEEPSEKIAKVKTLADFSVFIKYADSQEELLPMMDQFGEFEDAEKIEHLINNLKGHNTPPRAQASNAGAGFHAAAAASPIKTQASAANKWGHFAPANNGPLSTEPKLLEAQINQYKDIMPEFMKKQWQAYQEDKSLSAEATVATLRSMEELCKPVERKPLKDLLEQLATILEKKLYLQYQMK